MRKLHVITPVKDSIELSLQTISAVAASDLPEGTEYTVFNDRSTPENRERLTRAAADSGCNIIHIEDITDRPSPNYITILRMMRKKCISEDAHLCIVESDVIVQSDTICRLWTNADKLPRCGLAAAVTVDTAGNINYPYDKMSLPLDKGRVIPTRKHLSFCCTVLTAELLKAVDFDTLDDSKSWFDVTISNEALRKGLINYVCTDLRVVHKPHGSRPWKMLKYSNPLKYYWQKYTKMRDRI
ncbi:MAG: glycosyltransferase family 2 protein [Rikenellaceae bacterium]|nr:glycosyltransferase family 2 protein [Rikenellaceae bacterium]